MTDALYLMKFSIAALHFLVMCILKLSPESSHTPRYLMMSDPSIKLPATLMDDIVHF